MKHILFTLMGFLSISLFMSCETKEEKALTLIDEKMFQTLYDYDSYQPVETVVDSAFSSVYRDTLAVTYALYISALQEHLEKTVDEINKNLDRAKIYVGSYYSQDIYQEYINKAISSKDVAEICIDRMKLYEDSIRIISDSFIPEFIGWEVMHRFRCKSKGGSALLSDFVYLFDKDFNEIVYYEDTEDELTVKIKKIITDALTKESRDDKSLEEL